jgi:TPR repeat protein
MYANGRGVVRDDTQAAAWWQKAADQGDAVAQLSLGWMYANGLVVPKDGVRALDWIREAAEQGNATAQAVLERLGKACNPDRSTSRR